MYLYTIGTSKKSLEQFCENIKYHMIQLVVDVRLKNDSQLLGFARKRDLPYALQFHKCEYEHCLIFAPTSELLIDWKKKRITWAVYEKRYKSLMLNRNAVKYFLTCYDGLYDTVCLLCSEPTPEHCHRRLLAEMIHEQRQDIEIIHI